MWPSRTFVLHAMSMTVSCWAEICPSPPRSATSASRHASSVRACRVRPSNAPVPCSFRRSFRGVAPCFW